MPIRILVGMPAISRWFSAATPPVAETRDAWNTRQGAPAAAAPAGVAFAFLSGGVVGLNLRVKAPTTTSGAGIYAIYV